MSTATPVLITGDEQLLIDRAVHTALVRARKVDPEVERREASAVGLSLADFAELVAPSLFAEPRVVVIRGAHEAAKELATEIISYIADPVDGVTLVIQHGGGARNKALVDACLKVGSQPIQCSKISRPDERATFVRAEIKAAGGTTTSDAALALVEAIGSDLRELASAASQLVADTGGLVDDAAVRRYYKGRADVTGFAVSDKVIVGDIPGGLEALRWALSVGLAHVLIADALADAVRSIAKVAGAGRGNTYQLASQLGMPSWKVERAQGQSRGWTPAGLANAVAVTARLNGEVKGGAADPDYALEKAIMDIGRARRMK
ncbi:DNA polymerase III subunit delta [Nakamurella antarctica]|uniref:DNA-directed DNA polymerase n=1 Tax=Nakamurella antarctica TaxID=1902245 RepID=A0A3G8ZNR0_9ACTN|nr:DNA polymerase III subunit delta [Nakamurella antarctica]AZI58425.1 DNA polymerase III subunit delta [Nakamurella antarctica]